MSTSIPIPQSSEGLFGRVLLVDDDPAVRDYLVELLTMSDYQVVAVANGKDAVDALTAQPFDLLLTDLSLPDIDGIEVIRRAKRLDPDLAAIIITGRGSLASAIQAMQSEAFDYICKPPVSEELLSRVGRAMDRRRLVLHNRELMEQMRLHQARLEEEVRDATASLRSNLRELEQINREQSCLYALTRVVRGKTLIAEVMDTVLEHLRGVIPLGPTYYAVFDATGQLLARADPGQDEILVRVDEILSGSGDRLRGVLTGTSHGEDRVNNARTLLVHGGAPPQDVDDLVVEPVVVGQSLFGLMCVRADQAPTWGSRHQQMLSLAITQITSVCEENLLLERGTQLATMGELVSEIVHDLRSPLTTLRNNAKFLIERYGEDEDSRDSLSDMLESASQMEGLVGELLAFARPDEMQLGHVVVAALIENALRMTRDYLERKSITVHWSPETSDVTVTGNGHQLVEALVNLIMNAAQAMEPGGRLTLTLEPGVTLSHEVDGPRPAAAQRFARLCVSDTGCGIPARNLAKIFHRFYTTKPKGSGLGMSSVQRIVRQNLGYIAVESEEGVGTTVVVYLLQ